MPVFEQGYKHWDGELSGHAWRWWTIARQGVRIALQSWILRLLTMMAMTPAVALVGVLVLWGFLEQQAEWVMPIARAIFPADIVRDPGSFRIIVWTLAFHFFFRVELFIAMVLVLLVGPGLISQDLRFNAVTLYLSRPLYRWDYFLGKLGVIGFFLALVAIVPALLAYLLGVLFSFKLAVIFDTWHLLLGCLGYGLVIVLSAGTLMLALSSLSRSSRYVAAFWVGIWIISSMVASAMSSIHVEQTTRHEAQAFQPVGPPRRFDPNHPRGPRMPQQVEHWQRRQEAMIEAYLNDWRPIIAYTGNLERVGRALLGVDTVAERVGDQIADANPMTRNNPELARMTAQLYLSGPQFPVYWSALILLALFGASLWLLTTRVRTLDRLS